MSKALAILIASGFGFAIMLLDFLWMKSLLVKKLSKGISAKSVGSYLLFSLLRWAVFGTIVVVAVSKVGLLKENIIFIFAGLTIGMVFIAINRSKSIRISGPTPCLCKSQGEGVNNND
ncbi:hypothetical protein ACFL6Y_05400 [Elusimicrobiota bacterium]